eukprot:CFRG6398T1
MGIAGLLNLLDACTVGMNVAVYSGQTVGVDANSWIYKGLYGCSAELLRDVPTDKYIQYCANRLDLLLDNDVTPIMVFDGRPLPAKWRVHDERRSLRTKSQERARALLATGEREGALKAIKKSLCVTSEIIHEVYQVCKAKGVKSIVAPYEADAQLAYLYKQNEISAVITEDSDLIPFGVKRIFFKMSDRGDGFEFCSSRLAGNCDLKIDLRGWTPHRLIELCVLSGCDYLPSIPGMGLKLSYIYLQKHRTFENVIAHLRQKGKELPYNYESKFHEAVAIFLHQLVYDPVTRRGVPLQPRENINGFLLENEDALGPNFGDANVHGVAMGELHPLTLKPYCKKSAPCSKIGLSNHSPRTSHSETVEINVESKNSFKYQIVKNCDAVSLEQQEIMNKMSVDTENEAPRTPCNANNASVSQLQSDKPLSKLASKEKRSRETDKHTLRKPLADTYTPKRKYSKFMTSGRLSLKLSTQKYDEVPRGSTATYHIN